MNPLQLTAPYLDTLAVPEITVSHLAIFPSNDRLFGGLYGQASDQQQDTVSKAYTIQNPSNYNGCHIKLIAYLTVARRPSDDATHRMLPHDHRQQ